MQKAQSEIPSTTNQKPQTNVSLGGPIPNLVDGSWLVVCSEGRLTPIEALKKHQIVELIGALSEIRRRKYLRNRELRYGNINRGFTEEELVRFFAACKHKKAKMAFMLQAFLGLRIGEAVRVRIDDIDFRTQRLRVSTEKARTGDMLFLHDGIKKALWDWVSTYEKEITSHGGYVLFSSNPSYKRDHISKDWLRGEFRRVCSLAGLLEWYAQANDQDNPHMKGTRRLYRLSTHSLRHYFITRVYRQSKNMKHTQKLARHTDIGSTQTYIYTCPEELEQTMREVFAEPITT